MAIKNKLILGDSLYILEQLEDNSVDSVVTDPPYGLSFMGKKWDYAVPIPNLWREVLRVLKPGGHLLSFAGSRTYHRMAVNIEDAGFEIRDQIMWVYGSGFPKSLNIGKAVDKLQGNEREDLGASPASRVNAPNHTVVARSAFSGNARTTKGNSPYEGWGTALKPAHEPIVVARKPISEKSIAENTLKWGTGGINIDGCRVGTETVKGQKAGQGFNNVKGFGVNTKQGNEQAKEYTSQDVQGRFPANFIHDGSDEVVGLFPDTKSGSGIKNPKNGVKSTFRASVQEEGTYSQGDSGSAARFFYCAKASKAERNAGLDSTEFPKGCIHPTVKPIKLMEYLIKLVTPTDGTTLDPFMGSGTTGVAAKNLGFDFIGIELDEDYFNIAKDRIADGDKK